MNIRPVRDILGNRGEGRGIRHQQGRRGQGKRNAAFRDWAQGVALSPAGYLSYQFMCSASHSDHSSSPAIRNPCEVTPKVREAHQGSAGCVWGGVHQGSAPLSRLPPLANSSSNRKKNGGVVFRVQGYLAHNRTHPLRTLQ